MSNILFNETLEAAPVAGTPSTVVGSMATISPKGYTITLPNHFWYLGRALRFTVMGTIDARAQQINFRMLQLGETLVLWTAALFSTNNPATHATPIPYLFKLTLTCRAVGNGTNSNTIGVADFVTACNAGIGQVMYSFQDTASPKNLPVGTPTVGSGFDVNSALDMTFQGQGFFIDTQQFIIESLN